MIVMAEHAARCQHIVLCFGDLTTNGTTLRIDRMTASIVSLTARLRTADWRSLYLLGVRSFVGGTALSRSQTRLSKMNVTSTDQSQACQVGLPAHLGCHSTRRRCPTTESLTEPLLS